MDEDSFQGIILFNDTNSKKLSILNNALGIYKETPKKELCG